MAQRPDFQSLITGDTFSFKVGSEETLFQIPKMLIQSISPTFTAMMTAGMKEEELGFIELKHVEPDVFSAACEFALTGKYSTPSIKEEDHSPFRTREVHTGKQSEGKMDQGGERSSSTFDVNVDYQTAEIYSCGGRLASWNRTQPSRSGQGNCQRCGQFYGRDFESRCSSPSVNTSSAKVRKEFKDLCVDAPYHLEKESVFINPLFHAKVYCFAEEKLNDLLRQCSLSYFYQDLREFMPTAGTRHMILNVANFVYNNTGQISSDGPDPLRALIIHYVASQPLVLRKKTLLAYLLNQYAEMGSDLVSILVEELDSGKRDRWC